MKTNTLKNALRVSAAAGALFALALPTAHAQSLVDFETTNGTDLGTYVGSLVNGGGQNVSAVNNPNAAPVPTAGANVRSSGPGVNPMVNFSSNAIDPGLATNTFSFADNNGGAGTTIFGGNLFNLVLAASGGTAGDVLTLTFSQAVNNLSFNFATSERNTFTLTAGGQAFNTVTFATPVADTTVDPTGGTIVYEGTLTTGVLAGPFTTATLTLNGATLASAIDNLLFTAAPTAVPEPGVLGLAIAGSITGIGLLRRKRRS